ncbi:MAG: hypothetical protein KGL50_02455 [Burkholderiales bacterium]|nr:hypothetical protein [Burkholderiales bacterium]
MNRLASVTSLLLAGALAWAPAAAAPVGTGDDALSLSATPVADAPNPPAALAGSTGENTAATGAAGSSGSKTVDMLIELQARAQADGASGAKAERTASAPRRDRLADIAEKAARAAPLAQAPHFGGLFSTTA